MFGLKVNIICGISIECKYYRCNYFYIIYFFWKEIKWKFSSVTNKSRHFLVRLWVVLQLSAAVTTCCRSLYRVVSTWGLTPVLGTSLFYGDQFPVLKMASCSCTVLKKSFNTESIAEALKPSDRQLHNLIMQAAFLTQSSWPSQPLKSVLGNLHDGFCLSDYPDDQTYHQTKENEEVLGPEAERRTTGRPRPQHHEENQPRETGWF